MKTNNKRIRVIDDEVKTLRAMVTEVSTRINKLLDEKRQLCMTSLQKNITAQQSNDKAAHRV